MKVELIHNTPLWVCAKAIRKCWASEGKSDSYEEIRTYDIEEDITPYEDRIVICGEEDKKLIHRVGNKNKHSSTLEHLVYTFDIDGISRACLQELARHRMASYSVKSTRYTLKELREEEDIVVYNLQGKDIRYEIARNYIVFTEEEDIDKSSCVALGNLQRRVKEGLSNDIVKYCLPEAYKTSLVMTINARSLQNFLELRTSKSALWEIRELAKAMFDVLPEEHKYLFEEYVSGNREDRTTAEDRERG